MVKGLGSGPREESAAHTWSVLYNALGIEGTRVESDLWTARISKPICGILSYHDLLRQLRLMLNGDETV